MDSAIELEYTRRLTQFRIHLKAAISYVEDT
jgi:hypothetical protein